MEDFDLGKPLQKASSSVESDIKNSPHSLGLNLSTNRSSPHLSTNGVSSFSGKTRPSVIQGTVEVLTSLMQELHNSGKTDSELWKNCETRWLQLFNLVEKQCQEQIVAQQEQFHNQIQRIQKEIKNLVKLQTNNASWASCDRSSLSRQISSESQMGFFSENSERNESVISYPKSKEPEMQRETSMSQPDCNVDSSSVSSGYGTFCVSELNTYKPKDAQEFMEHAEVSKGQFGAPVVQKESLVDGVKNQSFYIHTNEEFCASLKEDTPIFPGEFEHSFLGENKISEVYSGKTDNKSITSWAQKLKQNQPKRAHKEEGCSKPMQGNEQTRKSPIEKSDFTAATHSRAFYLNKPDESPNCWMSDSGTGLTYWKLEEKDTYHSLPKTPASSTDISPSQSNTSNEMKLPSLKDIYYKKQRENKQLPERNLPSASNPNHPPEVLTLDPTLHLKPSQQISGIQPHGFLNALDDRISFSPDSVLEPSMASHSDIDSFSQASHVTSQLSGFPRYPSSTKVSPVDSWKNHAFQNESRTSSTFPAVYTIGSNDISVNSVDEENTGLVPFASVSQSQLPGTASGVPECISLTSLEDPVILSKVRQNLKEKHARHIADLRAYYESEINSLKQKLEAKEIPAVEDWKKTNQILVDRCGQLDSALNEATSRVRTLENKNNLLEREVSDLRERFSAASSASKILQERIEEMRTSNKEKDNTILRLKSRLQDLEEAFENAYKLSDDKEARLKQENKMFQDLLGEYESLGKEHERVKDTLNKTENKLLDAHTQISDLKRTISKLEAQVKQVEHENMLSLRHNSKTPMRPSRANTLASSDVSRRKWLIPGAEHSIFTGQPLDTRDSKADSQPEDTCLAGYHSPLEKDPSPGSSPTSLLIKKQRDTSDTPIMKALKELDEEKVFKNWGTQTEKEDTSNKLVTPRLTDTSVNASRSPEKGAQQRQKRFNSASQRSSSLPPSNRKSSTPTKREIMLTPVTVAYSPKRSPKENLSPGFSHLLSKNESSPIRFDILLDDLDTVPVSTVQRPNPRKQLQFLPLDDSEEKKYSEKTTDIHVNHSSSPEPLPSGVKKVSVRSAWEKNKSVSYEQCKPAYVPPQGNDFEYTAKIRTLAETERFFDELTKEKDQIEAALSRMPSTGGRITLQTRLNQEALEDRLEKINRELGSVRMTLKKFHVLRTSANL
ncbi:M-phase phosphoprotein 9 isoform X1 [Tursiops truncatus]|uniref:M-phase phosphoprotein 9 isoform X1 n=5 Tax=Tursiops truncatus TaxID=9739 RepID=A0A2U4CK43_TURTR|nr:M-phase phosphoprotein 9 isoform X1 [Tursiops truncatus]XP_019805818.2 M-phase phosphoprotein 9 isoform X1 [Tursiops truncatus]XP_019805819.2 M-phase phosphoprotein 9 isoform X1 [Tursiops truncatus]XP_033692665.1 M-phase phosphoprotein 9 isoform X1 [Tursiops truncatus]